MKNNILISLFTLSIIAFSSCTDWLQEDMPGVTRLKDFFTSGQTAVQNVTGAYVPLMWEYNTTFYPEWFIGDVVSDDALKGGQDAGDMADVYDMENFKTNTNNTLLLDFYRGQYQGVARCNLSLEYIPGMATDTLMDARMKSRLIGEAKFLRAMYYFRLVRVFGDIPLVDFVVDSSSKWYQQKASAQDIYNLIIEDLLDAQERLWLKSEYGSTDLGRATKGAAQAMLLKAYLYTKQYDEAKAWGDSIIDSGEYSLVEKYRDNFTLEGENGKESVFEIQYMEDDMSDYGGDGFTRGTFTMILTRSRTAAGGWGFNRPTRDLYAEYEPNDIRREETILDPHTEEEKEENDEIGNYLHSTYYVNKKYALMNEDGTYYDLTHHSRGPINNKVIRYADVLLMYAEACCESGNQSRAKWALEEVRKRARQGNDAILPAFPYETEIQGVIVKYADNKEDLRKAIRHERRVELAMEGHRWFDICRWDIAKETMDAYKAKENEEVQSHMAPFVKGKHELFPIPSQEIDLSKIPQNPNY